MFHIKDSLQRYKKQVYFSLLKSPDFAKNYRNAIIQINLSKKK